MQKASEKFQGVTPQFFSVFLLLCSHLAFFGYAFASPKVGCGLEKLK